MAIPAFLRTGLDPTLTLVANSAFAVCSLAEEASGFALATVFSPIVATRMTGMMAPMNSPPVSDRLTDSFESGFGYSGIASAPPLSTSELL